MVSGFSQTRSHASEYHPFPPGKAQRATLEAATLRVRRTPSSGPRRPRLRVKMFLPVNGPLPRNGIDGGIIRGSSRGCQSGEIKKCVAWGVGRGAWGVGRGA
jgi:hypothetical protein